MGSSKHCSRQEAGPALPLLCPGGQLALPHCPGEGWGQLSCVLQPVRSWANSAEPSDINMAHTAAQTRDIRTASGDSTGSSHQAAPSHPSVSGSPSLLSIQSVLLLFLSHLSSTDLLITVASMAAGGPGQQTSGCLPLIIFLKICFYLGRS